MSHEHTMFERVAKKLNAVRVALAALRAAEREARTDDSDSGWQVIRDNTPSDYLRRVKRPPR